MEMELVDFWSSFLFIAGGICSLKAGKRLLCHLSLWQWVFCCVLSSLNLEEDYRKHWMVLRHGPASWRDEEEV